MNKKQEENAIKHVIQSISNAKEEAGFRQGTKKENCSICENVLKDSKNNMYCDLLQEKANGFLVSVNKDNNCKYFNKLWERYK